MIALALAGAVAYEACLLCFRPILVTTMAATLGALPLAVGMGTGAEFGRSLGITIIGGLLVSQLLTLYTTPVVYLYFDRLQHWWERVRLGQRQPEPIEDRTKCNSITGALLTGGWWPVKGRPTEANETHCGVARPPSAAGSIGVHTGPAVKGDRATF